MNRLRQRDNFNGAALGLDQNNFGIKNRSCSTHPRAEHRAMGGCLMLSMVPGVFCGLRLSQPTDREHGEDECNR